jgi:putative tricarboxylic transport membrane protein
MNGLARGAIRPADAVAAVVLWAIAAIIWWQSTKWPQAADVAGNPVVLPRALALIMIATGLGLVLLRRPAPLEDGDTASHRLGDTLAAIGATMVLAVLLDPLGLVPAGILYVLALQRLVGAPWRLVIPFALATPVAIWLIFASLLNVPLPAGLLAPLLRP